MNYETVRSLMTNTVVPLFTVVPSVHSEVLGI